MQRPVHTAKVIPLTGTSRAAKQSSLPKVRPRASKTNKQQVAFAAPSTAGTKPGSTKGAAGKTVKQRA